MTVAGGTAGSVAEGQRLSVMFAIPHLARGGGAERVMITLLQRLDRTRFEPSLMVLDAARNELTGELPADVPVIDLGVHRVRHAWRPLRAALRETRPQVLLSGLGHLNLMIAMLRPLLARELAVIGRETAVVTEFNAEFGTAKLRNLAYRHFYPRLDLVICQSQDMRDDLVGTLGFPADRTRLVPNPVDVERVRARAKLPAADAESAWGAEPAQGADRKPLRLVAIGRLAPQKGIDLLLQAIAQLPADYCRLAIVGEGPERARLEAMADALKLRDRVAFRGYQSNPHAFLGRADALVLSSRYEGLPNVVLESLAIGTPVIAMPCPGGLKEIAGRTGGMTLAESIDSSALANAIQRFAALPDRHGGIDIGPWEADGIVRRYEQLIVEAAGKATQQAT